MNSDPTKRMFEEVTTMYKCNNSILFLDPELEAIKRPLGPWSEKRALRASSGEWESPCFTPCYALQLYRHDYRYHGDHEAHWAEPFYTTTDRAQFVSAIQFCMQL
jgi:hypothetical protein